MKQRLQKKTGFLQKIRGLAGDKSRKQQVFSQPITAVNFTALLSASQNLTFEINFWLARNLKPEISNPEYHNYDILSKRSIRLNKRSRANPAPAASTATATAGQI